MFGRLLPRIALSAAIAFTLSALLVVAGILLFERSLRGEMTNLMEGAGLRYTAAELSQLPREQRAGRLAEIQKEFSVPLMLRPRPPGPPFGAPPWPPPDAWGGPPPERLPPLRDVRAVMLPVGDDQALFVAPPRPSVAFPIAGALVFLLAVVLCLTALVALPLARRLRSIQRTLGELSRGNLSARADGGASDEVGQLAAALNASAERLQRMFAEREELLQAVSHDLGTPLSRMRFQLELLDRSLAGDPRAQQLRPLEDDIHELDGLSTELIEWAEADAAELSRRQVPLARTLEDIIELERLTTTKEVALSPGLPPDATVWAEPRGFSRAVENLIRNAVRYARTRVLVDVAPGPEAVVVSVRDDGPGIPEADRERVLRPFVRLEQSRSREHGGAGLGLAITRRIVERHGGRIEIDTAAEGGARVSVSWPQPYPG